MKQQIYYFKLYSFYKNRTVSLLRILLFIILTLTLVINAGSPVIVRPILALWLIFFVNEMFVNFKVLRMKPRFLVKDTKEPNEDVISFPALLIYIKAKNAFDLIANLHNKPEIRFIIKKIGGQIEPVKIDISKEELLKKTFELVKKTEGDYVREVDFFASYLLLTEEKTKVLEKNDLKEEDVVNLLYWARNKFLPKEESVLDFKFKGSGIFDFFIFGWNVETKKYASDLTANVLSYDIPPDVVGRAKEYDEMIKDLAKEKNNNVILIGDPGTGKTSLVEYFTYQSHLGSTPSNLSHKKVYELFADRIIAGVQNQGELEERINNLMPDIYYSKDTIIFIQNIENMFGGGGFNLDISGVIFQYLKNGKVQIIGTTTPQAYKTQLEERNDIKEFFETIKLDEPNQESALFMLFEKVGEIEREYKVSFTYSAITTVIKLSSSYLVDRFLPGKAINLLDEAAAEAKIAKKKTVDRNDIVKKIEEKAKVVIAAPSEKEKNILLNLEKEIHQRIIAQNEAVSAIANAIRRLRSGFTNQKRPISVFLFLGPTGVGKTETAKALASIYFGDEKKMIRVDMSEYQTQDSIKRLLGSLPGEKYSPSEFLEKVKENPFSLILLDEFEKAQSHILDVFLQVFEDGRLTDNSGRTISFLNTIIIATSNAGAELIREKISNGASIDGTKKEILDDLQKKGVFKPELLNRFDDVIVFKPLSETDIQEVVKLSLSQVLKLPEEKSIYINYDNKVVEKIAKEAYDPALGAREVRRYIENNIENLISKMILEDKLKKGDKKTLTVDGKNFVII